jgi:hypothetical protein
MGTFALVQFIVKEVVEPSGEQIRWTGTDIPIVVWRSPTPWPRWSPVPSACTRRRRESENALEMGKWTRCW